MQQLEALLADQTQTGVLDTIRGSAQVPLVEWLLVSDGRPDPQLRYLVGTSHAALIEDLVGLLRRCFPDTYELREVTWHPRYVEEFLPIGGPETAGHSVSLPTGETLDTTVHPYVAGVEYHGETNRTRDWQTPLAPFADRGTSARRSNSSSDHHHGPHRPSVAPVIETLCDAAVPVVYQLVCQTHGDWSGQANTYISRI